jgi:hypothetical protein
MLIETGPKCVEAGPGYIWSLHGWVALTLKQPVHCFSTAFGSGWMHKVGV